MQRRVVLLACAAAVLGGLAGCDPDRIAKLEEGVSTEADVRQQFGQPKRTIDKADGSKVLEYPRQPMGRANYRIDIGPDGKMTSLRQLLTPRNIAQVQTGSTEDQVREMLGMPGKTMTYPLKPNESEWEWYYLDEQRKKILRVTFGADHRAMQVSILDDMRETDMIKP